MKKMDIICIWLLILLLLSAAAGAIYVFEYESWYSIFLDFGFILLVGAAGIFLIISFQKALEKFGKSRFKENRNKKE